MVLVLSQTLHFSFCILQWFFILALLLTDHLQKGLDPGSELTHRTRRIDILQMKKRDIDRFIVGFSCGDLKAKGITIFVDIKNGTVHLEFLGIGSDITESRCQYLPQRYPPCFPCRSWGN